MAMTIGDANDVQTLLRALYGPALSRNPERRAAVLDHTRAAAQRLADRSSALLGAGQRGADLDLDLGRQRMASR